MRKSNLEAEFESYLKMFGVEGYEREYRFAKEIGRKWRFDFAFVPEKVAVELEGGVYSRGRHVRGRGFEKDAEKYNKAVEMGWAVLRFTGSMLREDPEGCINQLREVLGG